MWANVDPDLCHHMASLGQSALTTLIALHKTMVSIAITIDIGYVDGLEQDCVYLHC